MVIFIFWPFQWINERYGPIASNAFGFLTMFLAMFAPRLLEDKADRELKLKERVVVAKNTRVRVRAAQDLDAYHQALVQIQEEDLSYPLTNLRKMLRLPPADPASYSQARPCLCQRLASCPPRSPGVSGICRPKTHCVAVRRL